MESAFAFASTAEELGHYARQDERPLGCDSETGRLRRVLLAPPARLRPVPCNSVTRECLRSETDFSADLACRQHARLVAALEEEGVSVEMVAPAAGLPDLCYTRDTSLMTPWGLVGLSPGAPHRRREVDEVFRSARANGIPIAGRIERGTIEGGDIAMLRPGLLAIGVSGDRTDAEGAEALVRLFRAHGWDCILCPFDPHFLHLDTQFCMARPDLALACTDVLDDDFLAEMKARGIELVSVSYKEQRRLGCNLLALGDGAVLTAATTPRIDAELERRGVRVVAVDLSELVKCGGGVHCLTMPLARDPL
jgi:N-dimethylarginine dimethylaminohydrolase